MGLKKVHIKQKNAALKSYMEVGRLKEVLLVQTRSATAAFKGVTFHIFVWFGGVVVTETTN